MSGIAAGVASERLGCLVPRVKTLGWRPLSLRDSLRDPARGGSEEPSRRDKGFQPRISILGGGRHAPWPTEIT